MYLVREIFHLQFGRYREAKALFDEGKKLGIMDFPAGSRLLTDFTGEAYRFILEIPYESLAAFETELKKDMSAENWGAWYEKFKPLIRFSEREILKVIE